MSHESPARAEIPSGSDQCVAGQGPMPGEAVSRSDVPPDLIGAGGESIKSEGLDLIKLDKQKIDDIVRTVPGGARNVQDIYPLSALQEGMLFHHLLDEQSDTYILATLFQFQCKAQLGRFIDGLQSAIARHDALRSAVLWENLPHPVQVIYRQAVLPVTQVVLGANTDVVEQFKELLKAEPQRMNLQKAPLLRVKVASDATGDRWYALLQRHHIVFDHQSWSILFSEVLASMQGREAELQTPQSYRDYVAWSLTETEERDAQAFFSAKFSDVNEPTAPFGLLDLSADCRKIEEASQILDPALVQQIRTQARSLRVTAARLFHAAWALVIARTSGRDDVVCGTVLSGGRRARVQSRPAIGLFVNTLPFRLNLKGLTARELVAQTHRELTDLMSYRHISPTLAQRSCAIVGTTPLFTGVLNYRHSAGHSVVDVNHRSAAEAGIRIVMQEYRASYPIMLVVDDFRDAFTITAQTDRRVEPNRFLGYMRTALQSLVQALETAPDATTEEMAIIPESERYQIIETFNATKKKYQKEKLVHELFEQQVVKSPDAIAVTFDNHSLTYAELNRRANWLAEHLRALGVGPDQLVAIHVDRSPEMIVGLIGVLKAGGAYVPLDPYYPIERLRYMINDAKPRVILTQEKLSSAVSDAQIDLVMLDALMRKLPNEMGSDLHCDCQNVRPDNLVYVIYTSGTTGRPKGIAMPHRSIVNLVEWHREAFHKNDGRRVLQFAALSFDVASQEIFFTLCTGGCLLLLDEWVRRDARALTEFLISQSIERLFVPPLMLQGLAECHQAMDSAAGRLADVITAGEQLRITPEISAFFEQHAGCRLHNHYGPTEAHVVTALTFAGEPSRWPNLPDIGRPISNTEIYVLDARLRAVPLSVTGEIYIGGVAVARGYLKRPELTAERFIADPHGAEPGARLYKTGDLGRLRVDGTVEYLGRNDDQVKVRGYRIEPREIEAQVTRLEGVKDAAVVVREDVPGEKRIVAYITRDHRVSRSVEELRKCLKEALPAYMVPSTLVALESLPTTPSGKLDRRGLPPPPVTAASERSYDAPQGDVEEKLAGLWRELLHVDRVGRQDNFFDLGGHSLLALKALLRINQAFGTSLRVIDVYKSPTLRELGDRLRGSAIEDDFIDLSREAKLALEIVARPGHPRIPPKGIMLTGVTGFVGRFLLVQLLRDTEATLYCLVRAPTQHQAYMRLRTTLARWDLWRDEFAPRIVAIPGDLRLPRLGVDEITYQLLSQKVESIYHCATSMNHLETYEMAKVANVGSAMELLKLATSGEQKHINYISTLGVFSSSTTESARLVDEMTSIDHERHRASRGYVASKWVAERIFMTARERGIPCNIFRLGLIWGDTEQGRYDELQREYRVLKSCLLSGYGIRDYRYDMAPVPVDCAVRAVAFLGNRPPEGNGIFHICSSASMAQGVFERCGVMANESLELLSLYDWIGEMRRLHQSGRSLPVVPLIEFAFAMDEEAFNTHLRRNRVGRLLVDCEITRRQLELGGVTLHPIGDDLLRRSIDSMLLRDPELREVATRKRDRVATMEQVTLGR